MNEGTPDPGNNGPEAVIALIWERNRDDALSRVAVLEDAVAALIEHRLSGETRRAAEREAHRLTGSAGTFGFHRASESARQLERIFSGTEPVPVDSVFTAADAVVALRAGLGRDGTTASAPDAGEVGHAAAPARGAQTTLIVAVGGERRRRKIAAAAAARGLGVIVLEDPAQTPSWEGTTAAALVDLGFAGVRAERLIADLASAKPAIPSLALAPSDVLGSRLAAVRAGAQGFSAATAPVDELLDAVEGLLPWTGTADATVLVVDDDPVVLTLVRAVLSAPGLRVVGVEDPSRFWTALEAEQPDLVILDLDMPTVRGDDLCRVIRGDARWAALPVMFLTSNRDVDTLAALFAAGADDLVQKPFTGPGLLERVRDRLDRTQPLQATTRVRESRSVPGLYEPADQALHRAPQQGPTSVLPASPTGTVQDVDVVIVEDDTALAELLAHALATRGYTFRRLTDGQEAADQLAGSAPTLRGRVVLLDVDLPALSGFGVLREMVSAGQLVGTRVIMLTARSGEREILQALEQGAFDHVSKPFSVPVLMQRIHRALEA